MRRRSRFGWCVAVLLLASSAVAQVGAWDYSRPIVVADPGWVRVALDFDVLAHRDGPLRLFDPEGEPVPFSTRRTYAMNRRHRVKAIAVTESEEGWSIVFDTGTTLGTHERLHFPITRQTVAAGTRLEASVDGKSWRHLVTADLFSLGTDPTSRYVTLDYSPTSERYLRLLWPRQAEFPEVETITVERPAPPGPRDEDPETECARTASDEIECFVRLAKESADRLEIVTVADDVVGYRLAHPVQQTWRLVAEGAWQPSEAKREMVRSLRVPDLSRNFRLELWSESRLEVVDFAAIYFPTSILFEASTGGVYTLAYGGGAHAPPLERTQRRAEAPEDLPLTPLGAERYHPTPLDAQAVGRAEVPLPEIRFHARFDVRAPGAAPGDLVELELPVELHTFTREDLSDLRLASDGLQIPFVLSRREEPVAVLAGASVSPRPAGEAHRSRLEIDLPAEVSRLTQLELTARGGPFARGVRVVPGEETSSFQPPTPVPAWSRWSCRPNRPIPCRQNLLLPGALGTRLALELDDGDDPPLESLTLDLWRAADAVHFLWPSSGTVELLAGSDEVGRPDYDLYLLRKRLLAAEAVDAKVDVDSAAIEAAAEESRQDLLLLVALAVAALFLLAYLAKILTSSRGADAVD